MELRCDDGGAVSGRPRSCGASKSAGVVSAAATAPVISAAARTRAHVSLMLLPWIVDTSSEAPGGFHVGRREPRAATRDVAVVGPGGTRGDVVASVPLDRAFVHRLEGRAGLENDDQIILLDGGRIVVGPAGAHGPLDLVS